MPDLAPAPDGDLTPPEDTGDDAGGETLATQRFVRWYPRALVVVPVVFSLWNLRAERFVVNNLNDTATHRAMVEWAREQLTHGRLPLDGWFPRLSLGWALFHHYQSLPHLLTALLALAIGSANAVQWVLYLGLSLWPIAIYASGRLFGMSPRAAAVAAIVSPLLSSNVGYGYEHGSYLYRGNGVWSQLWGMWLLPFTLALLWRAVRDGRRYGRAAALLAVTIACHFLTGYVAVLALGAFVLLRPHQLVRRVGRAALVGVGALLTASWVLVPLLSDSRFTNLSDANSGTFWLDSYGASKVVHWLVTGRLLDHGRAPVVSVLALLGLVSVGWRWRHDEGRRAVLAAGVVSLVLFCGRPTFGWLLDLLPGSKDIFLHRYIAGVQLCAIFLAGYGVDDLAHLAVHVLRKRVAAVDPQQVALLGASVAAASAVFVMPAFKERARFDADGRQFIEVQRAADVTRGKTIAALVAKAKQHGPGRIYAGQLNGWGNRDYVVGYAPAFALLLNDDAELVGFNLRTSSLMSDIESRFDPTSPVEYDVLGIRYAILPATRQPPAGATLLDDMGTDRLWQVSTSGYFAVEDAVGPALRADRTSMGDQPADFFSSPNLSATITRFVNFDGSGAPAPTYVGTPPDAPGRVDAQTVHPDDGQFAAQVSVQRTSVVVLKATYHPRFTVEVDGVAAHTVMVAPGFVGVEVGPGEHQVRFVYRAYPYYPWLLGLGAVTLTGLAVLPAATERALRARAAAREAQRSPVTWPASSTSIER